jgi:predicted NAD/FAD-binding protein
MRIAVIGGGVSGLGAAWLAEKKHHVKLYEKAPRIGGHAHTVDAHFGDHKIAVDNLNMRALFAACWHKNLTC